MGKDKKTWKKVKKQKEGVRFKAVTNTIVSLIKTFNLTNEQAFLLLNDILLYLELEGVYTKKQYFDYLREMNI